MVEKFDENNENHRLLYVEQSDTIDKLFEIYRKDKRNAGIYFRTNGKNKFKKTRIVLFKTKTGFDIVTFEKSFGISVTNKMYSHEKRLEKIVFKKSTAYRIVYTNGKPNVQLLKPHHLQLIDWRIILHFRPWMKFIKDNEKITGLLTFNTVYSKKLFTEKKLIRHLIGLPIKVYKRLITPIEKEKTNDRVDDLFIGNNSQILNFMNYSNFDKLAKLYWMDKNSKVKNIHLLDKLLIDKKVPTDIFQDTLKMGKILGETVDINWSKKRFIQQHDKWSIELTNLILELNNYDLNPKDHFIKFSEISGYPIFMTSKELGLEGKKQQHCVATYAGKVKNGISAIYKVSDYTLELSVVNRKLTMAQFKGFRNSTPPKELIDEVLIKIDSYNDMISDSGIDIDISQNLMQCDPLANIIQ